MVIDFGTQKQEMNKISMMFGAIWAKENKAFFYFFIYFCKNWHMV